MIGNFVKKALLMPKIEKNHITGDIIYSNSSVPSECPMGVRRVFWCARLGRDRVNTDTT